MDRGSICFRHPDFKFDLKCCTEMDWLETVSGEKYRLIPSEELLRQHERKAV